MSREHRAPRKHVKGTLLDEIEKEIQKLEPMKEFRKRYTKFRGSGIDKEMYDSLEKRWIPCGKSGVGVF